MKSRGGSRTLSILLPLLFSACGALAKCPSACTCSLQAGRKEVQCTQGGMVDIPVAEMDYNTHVLVIDPPADRPNNLTIGRIFLKFGNLEEVRIVNSAVPAIGDSTFWPGRRLRRLDLSRNAITFLRESDFNGLKALRDLDLSDNEIFATPSAPFRHLLNLRRLDLARNKLSSLVPRFFYLLSRLEELDLSGNSIGRIDPENLQDVKQLRVLRLARCRLTHLHPIIYQQLPQLELLDLTDNLIASLAPAEYRHLGRLSRLQLSGNLLTSLAEGTFHGQRLQVLTLSRNRLSALSERTFANSSVQFLDISHNRLEYVLQDSLAPLSDSLEVLNVSYNNVGNQAFAFMVTPLKSLRQLQATDLHVTSLFPGVFSRNGNLTHLNLSRNSLAHLSPTFLTSLDNLEVLDASFNRLPSVSGQFLRGLANISSFQALELRGNPFDCSSCALIPLIQGLNDSHFLEQNCSGEPCLRCQEPQDKFGRYVHTVIQDELLCFSSVYDRQYLEYTSQIGMIVAVSIIVVIVVIILVIIVVYRRHIAHYYTHEEERRAWKSMYENPALAPSGAGLHPYSDEKPTFISIPEKVDENIEDLHHRPLSAAATAANVMR